MRNLQKIGVIIIIGILVASCGKVTITTVVNPTTSPTLALSTSTVTFNSIETVISTLPATLEPERANEFIRTLLQEPIGCEVPCFWGIKLGQTTLDEAINTFAHLGLSLKHTAKLDGQEFYAIIYKVDNEIDVSPIFAFQNNILRSLSIGINDTAQSGTPRKWSAYSPETLVSLYGQPSRVDFFLGRVAPTPIHSMVLYFEAVGLIVEYSGINILNKGSSLGICPLTNNVDFINIWMGDVPQYPPPSGVVLEKATSLTIEEFSDLILGPSDKACFNLIEEAFPQ